MTDLRSPSFDLEPNTLYYQEVRNSPGYQPDYSL